MFFEGARWWFLHVFSGKVPAMAAPLESSGHPTFADCVWSHQKPRKLSERNQTSTIIHQSCARGNKHYVIPYHDNIINSSKHDEIWSCSLGTCWELKNYGTTMSNTEGFFGSNHDDHVHVSFSPDVDEGITFVQDKSLINKNLFINEILPCYCWWLKSCNLLLIYKKPGQQRDRHSIANGVFSWLNISSLQAVALGTGGVLVSRGVRDTQRWNGAIVMV